MGVFERKTNGIQWVGIVVAIAGVLYIVARGNPVTLVDLSFNVGDAILIACNLGLAGYGVVVKRLPGISSAFAHHHYLWGRRSLSCSIFLL